MSVRRHRIVALALSGGMVLFNLAGTGYADGVQDLRQHESPAIIPADPSAGDPTSISPEQEWQSNALRVQAAMEAQAGPHQPSPAGNPQTPVLLAAAAEDPDHPSSVLPGALDSDPEFRALPLDLQNQMKAFLADKNNWKKEGGQWVLKSMSDYMNQLKREFEQIISDLQSGNPAKVQAAIERYQSISSKWDDLHKAIRIIDKAMSSRPWLKAARYPTDDNTMEKLDVKKHEAGLRIGQKEAQESGGLPPVPAGVPVVNPPAGAAGQLIRVSVLDVFDQYQAKGEDGEWRTVSHGNTVADHVSKGTQGANVQILKFEIGDGTKESGNTYTNRPLISARGIVDQIYAAIKLGVSVFNFSWAIVVDKAYRIVQPAIQALLNLKNVVVVAAAGNSGTSRVEFPANMGGRIVAVSTKAGDRNQLKEDDASFGGVDLAVPKDKLTAQGTSFSAGYISGVLARIWSQAGKFMSSNRLVAAAKKEGYRPPGGGRERDNDGDDAIGRAGGILTPYDYLTVYNGAGSGGGGGITTGGGGPAVGSVATGMKATTISTTVTRNNRALRAF